VEFLVEHAGKIVAEREDGGRTGLVAESHALVHQRDCLFRLAQQHFGDGQRLELDLLRPIHHMGVFFVNYVLQILFTFHNIRFHQQFDLIAS